ncbi:MAG TPA: alpha/beta fold hydrolase [Thermoflexales bacterium]|nr:alpha/beta fold hydrolase [Thermoflexales bacterium]
MKKTHINGIDLYYTDIGPQDTTPILFLHGFPFDHTMWDQQLIYFPSRVRCIAPDLRGFGQSGYDGPRSINDMADDMLALLDAIGVKGATVCGLSMGGYIALAMWRKAPQKFAKLVLADTKAPGDTPEGRAARLELAKKVLDGGSSVQADANMPKLFAEKNTKSAAAGKIRRLIESQTPKSIAATLQALADRADSTPTLATINAPTLVLVGQQDALTPVSDAAFMRDRIKGSQMMIIHDAGHMSPMENYPEFNAALEEFLG